MNIMEKSKKLLYRLKNPILILSLYFIWMVIIGEDQYGDPRVFSPVPFTIITIYVWRRFIIKDT